MRAVEVIPISPKLFTPVKPERLELLELAYEVFLKCKIVNSQSVFSTFVLKMKPSYYSCMRARNRKPNQIVFDRILNAAKFYHRALELNKHFNKPYAERLNQTHEDLDTLINTIEAEVTLNNVCM
ncbi:MAG: hypothetical protein ABJO86_14425 [Lentilitoribacter sp.]